jgi:hypothetical protein
MRQVFSTQLNNYIVLGGRVTPTVIHPHMKMSRYLNATATTLPTPPDSINYSPKALTALKNIYLNNKLGDCVIAAAYHIVGVETGNATGDPFIATSTQITNDYSKIGGYVPGNSRTDRGCEMQTALAYYVSKGFANGTKALGYIGIDATNATEMKQALYLFENLDFGIALPDAWITPFPSKDGFTWDSAGQSDPQNGHSFSAHGYSADGVLIDTWGMIGTLTWKAIAKYATNDNGGELYVIITPDQIAKGAAKAPNGFDWTTLISDFNAMGGNLPVPTPTPTPVPTPTPTPTPSTTVTLVQAQAWAASGLAANWPKS